MLMIFDIRNLKFCLGIQGTFTCLVGVYWNLGWVLKTKITGPTLKTRLQQKIGLQIHGEKLSFLGLQRYHLYFRQSRLNWIRMHLCRCTYNYTIILHGKRRRRNEGTKATEKITERISYYSSRSYFNDIFNLPTWRWLHAYYIIFVVTWQKITSMKIEWGNKMSIKH